MSVHAVENLRTKWFTGAKHINHRRFVKELQDTDIFRILLFLFYSS